MNRAGQPKSSDAAPPASGSLTGPLRERGLRPTSQRLDVLGMLARHPVHPTAEEIFGHLTRRHPRVSRATVYNTLKALTRAGLVREVPADGKAARYDLSLHRHHHFVCDHCGRIEDIGWFDIPPSSRSGAVGSRSVREYEVVFRGLCDACRRPHSSNL